ncbi:aspartate/glutamate racemase family protein [Marinivivus vitaminiproducens]|uniref:aspartate/glutamate racemase family protein n=1 Tax=Marinivivus vitaminiproducens TaxID=3035935 RepID=UPI00279A6E3C|nr:aspartate/glutamate racemase family protein [Geminicoccaceae bacterium SCSIO 64248]
MKTLGLIGGLSWESTAIYYRLLNAMVRERLGGLHSARLLLWSFDFEDVAERQHRGDWEGASALMVEAARKLEQAGAEALVICSNTMHRMAGAVRDATTVPLIHIADATATAVVARGVVRPALLATRFTMEQDFYKGRLRDPHGLDPMIPDEDGRALVHRIIYDELCQGIVRPESKALYLERIERLAAEGADGVILGCTEVTMLIGQADIDLPVFDTTFLHAKAAIDFSLSA